MTRATSYDTVRTALDAQWALLVRAFATADPAAPTRCAGWTVHDLDRHLGEITGGLARLVAAAAPGRADTDVAGWAAAVPALARDIDREARSPAGQRLAEVVPRVQSVLVAADPSSVVAQRTGRHTVADAALFRLVEAVVHGLDLPHPVPPDRTALAVVTRTLAAVIAGNAPGRSVEVRIPPHAAVQCVDGPRHTRGTQANVVEAEPIAFLALCTGRLVWRDAVRDGRVRISGERSDLSALLPLLT